MCDYSLQSVKTRAAVVDDQLEVRDFGTGTKGFAPLDGNAIGTPEMAVCVLPGTELAFEDPVEAFVYNPTEDYGTPEHKTARFRQIDRDNPHTHHDALELPDGTLIRLTRLKVGQRARVIQLPAAPKTPEEAKEQTRVAWSETGC